MMTRKRAHRLLAVVFPLVLLGAPAAGCKQEPADAPGARDERPTQSLRKETDRGRLTVKIFNAYQTEVVGMLKAALTGGGNAAAVDVCKDVSPGLVKKFADLPEVAVRRIAVRYRNPDNIPDAFEAAIFKEWEEGLARGEAPTAISRETAVGLRVMQPIMLGAHLCLRCHGEIRNMTPETVAMLKRKYPDDNATGFKLGEIRGAFSAIWRTSNAPAHPDDEKGK